jgi:hypothetical protein
MTLARLFRTVMLAALGSMFVYVPACSSSTDTGMSSNPLTAGVVRQGSVTDAALIQMVSTEADDWGWAGGVFDTPAADPTTTSAATISASEPFTFTWHADPTDSSSDAGAGNTPVGSGLSGMAYLLVFSTPGNAKLLRVFTTEPTYTPDAAAWSSLLAAAAAESTPLNVTLTTATFASDVLNPEGGPHKGQTLVLTIAN